MNSITVGIIGGSGQMGRWFKNFFEAAGHSVLIAGRKTSLSYAELARSSEVVILSVPIAVVAALCKEIGPIMTPDQLLMDICSLKESPLTAMLTNTSAQVVGTHPLFGPTTERLRGQNIIICLGRGSDRLDWLERMWLEGGAVLTRMDPIMHDKHMAVVQGLTHFLTIAMGRTLQKLNMPAQEAIQYSTPVFRTHLDLISRLFVQDLNLFQDLIKHNHHLQPVLQTFLSAVDEGCGRLVSGSNADGAVFMETIRQFLAPYCKDGFNESNVLLKALYS